MIEKSIKFLSLILFIFLVHCSPSKKSDQSSVKNQVKASIVKEGLITCFENGLSLNGQPVWCEASAILYDGKNLFFANDKDMPDQRSSVFYWPFKDGFADTTRPAEYLKNQLLKNGKKFEDFSISPNGKYIFLTTGFDRIKPGTSEWNAYNSIFYWKPGKESNSQIVRVNTTDSTSVFLRDRISRSLKSSYFPRSTPYFKLEGLAATDDKLYFGVREEGRKFDDFTYKIKIISISYQFKKGMLELEKDFTVVTDFNSSAALPSLKQSMGISSLEYDRFNKRFLILTSFENGEKLGGYLWTATLSELKSNKMNLVRDLKGNVLAFTHKAEDLTIVDKKKIIIIHDDDRIKTSVAGRIRQPNQAAYSIVEFK